MCREISIKGTGRTSIGVRGEGGGGGVTPPNCPNIHFRAKKRVIFGQNYLIFGQATEKLFEQETSAPPPRTKLVPYAYKDERANGEKL